MSRAKKEDPNNTGETLGTWVYSKTHKEYGDKDVKTKVQDAVQIRDERINQNQKQKTLDTIDSWDK